MSACDLGRVERVQSMIPNFSTDRAIVSLLSTPLSLLSRIPEV